MGKNMMLVVPVIFPIIAGIILFFKTPLKTNRRLRTTYVFSVLLMNAVIITWIDMQPYMSLYVGKIIQELAIYFKVDRAGQMFSMATAWVWFLVGCASFEYMSKQNDEDKYFGIYLIVGGVLTGLDFSGNLVTMYIFYEMMTLTSLPLVLHTLKKEAVMAGLKYLFYSMAGAFLSLFGILFFYSYGQNCEFYAGGAFVPDYSFHQQPLWLAVIFLMILGFSVKAGMFPVHGWLPSAHPIAPAPASAVLSGVITKAGVLAVIRIVYYTIGTEMIRGTWVQYAWTSLCLITIFMGSMMAYKDKLIKKRFAYSTISQVGYVMFGLSLMQPAAFVGALLHVIFHSLAKNTLFVSAGSIIMKTGRSKVTELRGLGKSMPVTFWCLTLCGLSLVGVPPLAGFVSKWYLAKGALGSGEAVISWLGPVILLVSALLTAGYILQISISAFLPGNDFDYRTVKKSEPGMMTLLPVTAMTAASVILGIYPAPLLDFVREMSGLVM